MILFFKGLILNSQSIHGFVFDQSNKLPIPYVNILNKSSSKGTISNSNGYFSLPIISLSDNIEFSFVGYNRKIITGLDTSKNYTIYLTESNELLDEVNVYYSDNLYLYNLISACRKSSSKKLFESKAYYQLKTFVDTLQTELVEGYYNAKMEGSQLTELNIKAGRLALRPFSNRLFASLESSRAILLLQLFRSNRLFPISPLNENSGQLKRDYYLELSGRYLDDLKDSVYVIDFFPRKDSSRFFSGKIWINLENFQLQKLELNAKNASIHPFLPHVSLDSISRVDFSIHETFDNKNGVSRFNTIDFEYTIYYRSRIGKPEEMNYSVTANAILYTYSFHELFSLPIFDFSDPAIGDYRKINALPYNSFFWTNNTENKIVDQDNLNTLFFEDSNSINNLTVFSKENRIKRGLFEHPYIHWSLGRIYFREFSLDSSTAIKSDFNSDMYHLSVKYYFDYCQYNGEIRIQSATIFDPFESYYALPIDTKANCFINLYFDFCEFQRRSLVEKLDDNKGDYFTYLGTYKMEMEKIKKEQIRFLKTVDRGTNRKAMEMYNGEVKSKLGIDNIALFKPYEE